MWFDCTKTALTKLKVAYNSSLRRFMGLPWHNSASEMFVNLNIKSFGELLRVFVHGFVKGLLYQGILCCQVLFTVMGLVTNIIVCSFVIGHIRVFSKKFLK